MADIKLAQTQKVTMRAGANLTGGMIVYRAERKGIVAKLARFIGKHLNIKRLSEWGYEALPAVAEEDYKAPIGIALDENTILIGGTLDGYPSDYQTPFRFSIDERVNGKRL